MKKNHFPPLLLIFLSSCGSADNTNKGEGNAIDSNYTNQSISNLKPSEKQLNVNILWDLSDRIDNSVSPASPPHFERDIEIIKSISEAFKNDMQKKGAYKSKSKIRVFFTPPPSDAAINTIAHNLSYDLSSFTGDGANKKKKEAYDSITKKFSNNALQIYNLTLQNNKGKKQWDGSDIWRFFKNDVKDYCIEPNNNYRNILIILTDGYIYHKDSRDKRGNRSAYILPETLKSFRNNPDWRSSFDKGDYGLITTRNDLQDLEVLVLEITPSKEYKNDEDFIKAYLGKWFEEMGIYKANYACHNSDLPDYIGKKIEQFLNK